MPEMKRYLLLVGAAICLTACSSVQELAQVFVDDARAGGTFGFGKQEPAHDVMDMDSMAGYMSTESVDVYDLDQPQVQSGYTGKRRTLPPMEEIYTEEPYGIYPPPPRETVSYGRPVYDDRAQQPAYTAQAAAQRGLPSTDSSVTLYPLEPRQPGFPVSQPMYPTPPYGGYPSTPQTAMGMPMQQPLSMPSTGVYVPGSAAAMYEQQQAMQVRTLPARIYFGHGKTSLDSTARQVLATVAEDVKAHHGVSIRIEGYASSRAAGNKVAQQKANMKTSMDRAQSVAKELVRLGVPENTIQTIGYGDTQPLTGHEGVNAEDASRRVEIHQVR